MSDVFQLLISLIAGLAIYACGYMAGAHRRSVHIGLIEKWPEAHIALDPKMSREDALRFLDMSRSALVRGELLQAQHLEHEGATNER